MLFDDDGVTVPRHERRNRRRRRQAARRRGLVAVALIVAVPLIAWSAYALIVNDSPADEHPRGSTGTAEPQPSAHGDKREDEPDRSTADDPEVTSTPDATSTPDDDAPGQPAAEEAAAACAASLDAGADVISEAETGITHWSEHIGARADWIAGRISDEEKSAIYKRTRLAGPDDQRRFHDMLTTYEELTGCDDLSNLAGSDGTADLDDGIQACLTRSEHTDVAISAASDAMADWQQHLDDMTAYANGDMSDAEANTGWETTAANAPTNINAFQTARDEWAQAPECGPGSTRRP